MSPPEVRPLVAPFKKYLVLASILGSSMSTYSPDFNPFSYISFSLAADSMSLFEEKVAFLSPTLDPFNSDNSDSDAVGVPPLV